MPAWRHAAHPGAATPDERIRRPDQRRLAVLIASGRLLHAVDVTAAEPRGPFGTRGIGLPASPHTPCRQHERRDQARSNRKSASRKSPKDELYCGLRASEEEREIRREGCGENERLGVGQ